MLFPCQKIKDPLVQVKSTNPDDVNKGLQPNLSRNQVLLLFVFKLLFEKVALQPKAFLDSSLNLLTVSAFRVAEVAQEFVDTALKSTTQLLILQSQLILQSMTGVPPFDTPALHIKDIYNAAVKLGMFQSKAGVSGSVKMIPLLSTGESLDKLIIFVAITFAFRMGYPYSRIQAPFRGRCLSVGHRLHVRASQSGTLGLESVQKSLGFKVDQRS